MKKLLLFSGLFMVLLGIFSGNIHSISMKNENSHIEEGQLSQQQDNTYSKYYYQRASQFEILPIVEEDIVFIENSITDYCVWAELFRNPNIKNRGISGDVAEGVLNRLSPIIKGKPKKIFLMVGINDMIKEQSPETIAAIIDKMVEKIQLLYSQYKNLSTKCITCKSQVFRRSNQPRRNYRSQ